MSVKNILALSTPCIKQWFSPFAKYNHYHIISNYRKQDQRGGKKKHLTNMSGSDIARKVVADVSGDDLDKWVRSGTLTNELEEVRKNHPQ